MKPFGPIHAALQAAAVRDDRNQEDLLEQAATMLDQPSSAAAEPAAAAIWYATAGIPVFPLQPGLKTPYPGSRGFKDATLDADQITAWFGVAPNSNIGTPTGHQWDVIDIDGEQGEQAFMRIIGDGGWLHICAVTETPRGYHLWVPADPTARNDSGSAVDYRGKGGYVVIPPSHVDGTMYRWLLPPW